MPYADEYVDGLIRQIERLEQANGSLSEDILRLQMKYDDMRDIARRLVTAL